MSNGAKNQKDDNKKSSYAFWRYVGLKAAPFTDLFVNALDTMSSHWLDPFLGGHKSKIILIALAWISKPFSMILAKGDADVTQRDVETIRTLQSKLDKRQEETEDTPTESFYGRYFNYTLNFISTALTCTAIAYHAEHTEENEAELAKSLFSLGAMVCAFVANYVSSYYLEKEKKLVAGKLGIAEKKMTKSLTKIGRRQTLINDTQLQNNGVAQNVDAIYGRNNNKPKVAVLHCGSKRVNSAVANEVAYRYFATESKSGGDEKESITKNI